MPKQIFTKEYEDYLISGSEESINSLPSGSLEKEYFMLIRQLLKEDLTPELEKKIESFIDKISEDQTYRLKALHIFKKIKKNPENKEDIIEEIKDLFHIEKVRNYSKPVKYNKTADMEKEENETQKLPHELKLEEYIYTDKFMEDIYKGGLIPDDNEYKKIFGKDIPPPIQYQLSNLEIMQLFNEALVIKERKKNNDPTYIELVRYGFKLISNLMSIHQKLSIYLTKQLICK